MVCVYVVDGVCCVCFSHLARGSGWSTALAECPEGSFLQCRVGGRGALAEEMSRMASDERDRGQRAGEAAHLVTLVCSFESPRQGDLSVFPALIGPRRPLFPLEQ